MKNTLLALVLFALVGTASAHDGKDGKTAKKDKKATCAMAGMAGGSCCTKKITRAALVKAAAPTATAVQKAL